MEGKACEETDGQTVKEGRGHMSNRRRMERSREAERNGLTGSPPLSSDAVPSFRRTHFQRDVTSCRVSFQSRKKPRFLRTERRCPAKVREEEREPGGFWWTSLGWCSSSLGSSAARWSVFDETVMGTYSIRTIFPWNHISHIDFGDPNWKRFHR